MRLSNELMDCTRSVSSQWNFAHVTRYVVYSYRSFFTHRLSNTLSNDALDLYAKVQQPNHDASSSKKKAKLVPPLNVIDERPGYVPVVASLMTDRCVQFVDMDNAQYMQVKQENGGQDNVNAADLLRMVCGWCARAAGTNALLYSFDLPSTPVRMMVMNLSRSRPMHDRRARRSSRRRKI